eukprot:843643-Pelagomonas_calceolata.AAC.5
MELCTGSHIRLAGNLRVCKRKQHNCLKRGGGSCEPGPAAQSRDHREYGEGRLEMEKGRGGLQDQSTGTWHGLGDGGVQELSEQGSRSKK